MADNLKEYKCPCCGGSLSFDSQIQKIKCPYCDAEFEISDIEKEEPKKEENLNWNDTSDVFQDDEGQNLYVYHCDSCGGEIICDENTAATKCPYCDSPVIISGRVSGNLKPRYVIPFVVTQEQALQGVTKYLKGKLFLVKDFKKTRTLEDVKSLYVPFWLFDADVDGAVQWEGTKENRYRRGNDEIIETSYYKIVREGDISFEKIPVDGSKKLADDLMESIEPFDFKNGAKDFAGAYLTGYSAEKYDVDSDETKGRANQRIRQGTINEFRKTVRGYKTVKLVDSTIHLNKTECAYAMYPVWLLTTKWNEKNYIFAANGQTGKITGNLPLSKLAYFLWFIGILGVLGGGLTLLIAALQNFAIDLDGLIWIIISFVLALLSAILFCEFNRRKLKGIKYQNGAANYVVDDSVNVTYKVDKYLYSRRRVIHHEPPQSKRK